MLLSRFRVVDLKFLSIQSGTIIARTGKPAFSLLILVIVLAFGMKTTDSFAFSFEGIDIQTKFGQRFRAKLDVLLEGDGDFLVQIGDENDYKRLELERPRIIDDLKIVTPVETGKRRRTFQVISERPLFFPSFNLVIRGTFKGGTLLENYLVTVDFQQNLTLNVKGQKKQGQEEPVSPPKEPVNLLKGGEATADSKASAEIQKESVAVEEMNVDAGEDAVPPKVADDKEPPGISPRVNAPSWMAKPPVELKGVRGKDAYFPGATWVSHRGFPDMILPMDPPQSQIKADDETNPFLAKEFVAPTPKTVSSETSLESGLDSQEENSSSTGAGYGPLAKGENLFSIAKKLNVGTSDSNRVAVALWMDNPGSFLYGNMNGIKEGSQLNLESLEKRLEEVGPQRAKEILRSQWHDWKVIQEKLATVKSEVFDGLVQEIPLPSENEDEKKMIFEMLRDWKETWESGDLDQHLTHFSHQSSSSLEKDFTNLRFLKKRMFVRHNQVKLRIQQASLVLNEGQTMVSFGQSFSSGKMESYGRKDIGVVWEDGAWKILKEKFKVNEYMEKYESDDLPPAEEEDIFSRERTASVPFVIHASSHLDHQMATQAVNQLRKVGFNAYSSPVNISRNRKIFRVYVGRFSSLDLAQELALKLKKYDFSRFAVPVKYPITFTMGEFESANEAEILILDLRSRGFSPLLFTFSEKEFLDPRFRVFLGAFATENDAAKLSDELKKNDLPYKLVTP